ncbi:MAG: hypothetical protein A2X81_06730 [Desulfobacterales bacterium GWB2_56_26]|nr:MAG: hypothetical protein A2X81_06730 [Desulfobacterales bacterium GWB2_56_26]
MSQSPEIVDPDAPVLMSGGYCRRCGKEHRLGPGNTLGPCRELMRLLARRGTIDLFSSGPSPDPALATAWLFGPARGKMFGILECLRPDGNTIFLLAFSGQYNGLWLVEGWVPPLFDAREFTALTAPGEKRIKELGRQIELCPAHSELWLALRKERRRLSRQLMREIHDLYRVTNFRGDTASLAEAFTGTGNIPTGTGDCCGPKLLNYAAGNGLRPVGLAEFYWGRENRSGSRRHDTFNGSCAEKCGPILGFMLCGLDDGREERAR